MFDHLILDYVFDHLILDHYDRERQLNSQKVRTFSFLSKVIKYGVIMLKTAVLAAKKLKMSSFLFKV